MFFLVSFQRRIQKPVKYLKETVNHFRKAFHLRCLTGLSIHLSSLLTRFDFPVTATSNISVREKTRFSFSCEKSRAIRNSHYVQQAHTSKRMMIKLPKILFILALFCPFLLFNPCTLLPYKKTEAYSEPYRTSKLELLQKQLKALSRQFSQKAPCQLFDRVFNTPLKYILLILRKFS